MNITIVQAEDWVGVYIGGNLKYESHSIDPSDLLNVVGVDHKWMRTELERGHTLPENLGDVKAV